MVFFPGSRVCTIIIQNQSAGGGMKEKLCLIYVFFFIMATIWPVCRVFAAGNISVRVTAILASQGAAHVDSDLKGMVSELRQIFKYSSYRSLGRHSMNLAIGQTGTASLAGGHLLKITPTRIDGNRSELQLAIFRNNQPVFQTVVQLLNNGSLFVGGPNYQGGYLLFNLYNRF